ncbi:transferrin-binding protein-like solute binding protein [Yoonia vestfoldensis]|uniref:transferrin-binding protein-like solute binding protein n=1 Tax=Yoonia vestfoldensis TaxID=245188 RepID=UPI00035DF31B|nr:transferrin-binding protein-like solute binding protein [Yoonia vestfoldensis]
MKQYIGLLLASCILPACGGGSGSDPGPSPLYLGTTSNTDSANGLAFAQAFAEQDGANLAPVVGTDTANLRLVRLRSQPTFSVDLPAATLSRPDTNRLVFTVDDEVFDLVSNMPNIGETDDITLVRFVPVVGEQVAPYRIADSREGNQSTSYFILGHETRPEALSGNVTYTLSVNGEGNDSRFTDISSDFRIFGTVGMNVDFGSGSVTGSGQLLTQFGDTSAGRTADVTLSGRQTGNGFDGSIAMACISGATCTSRHSFGGAFFGPAGQEVGGIGVIDESGTIDRQPYQVDAIFVFLGAQAALP